MALTAKLVKLSQFPGATSATAKVVLGIAISETDPNLPYDYVSGTLDWGDGSPVQRVPVSGATVSQIAAASSPSLARSGAVVIVTLTPTPYVGTFTITYNASSASLDFDSTAAAFEYQLSQLMPSGQRATVTGTAPEWTITFASSAAAAFFSLGSDTLFAPLALNTHEYLIGTFVASLTATNYRSPVPDTVKQILNIQLAPEAAAVQSHVIIGPILPLDIGYPNEAQWNFNISTDTQLLASNVKMILIVEPGERFMLPEYGTALRKFIFEPNDDTTSQDITTEIRRAIETWEPRVKIHAVDAVRNERTVSVGVICVSKLTQERFTLNVELER